MTNNILKSTAIDCLESIAKREITEKESSEHKKIGKETYYLNFKGNILLGTIDLPPILDNDFQKIQKMLDKKFREKLNSTVILSGEYFYIFPLE